MSSQLYVDADQLMQLFQYTNRRGFYNAVRNGKFPVATYKIGGKIYADVEVVREYFRRKRAEGMAALDS
jgi:hypothetical protein